MLALPLLAAPFRAIIGFKSDNHQSALGWRRVPFIWMGTLLQFGGFAIMPFALLVLAGKGHAASAPLWIGQSAAALAFLLGAYVFHRYKARPDRDAVRLVAPEGLDIAATTRIASACALAREMIDTPAADMGPLQIETIAREIAEAAGASIAVTTVAGPTKRVISSTCPSVSSPSMPSPSQRIFVTPR
jgi:hypothetical protein